jgi:hypothetical protein
MPGSSPCLDIDVWAAWLIADAFRETYAGPGAIPGLSTRFSPPPVLHARPAMSNVYVCYADLIGNAPYSSHDVLHVLR